MGLGVIISKTIAWTKKFLKEAVDKGERGLVRDYSDQEGISHTEPASWVQPM